MGRIARAFLSLRGRLRRKQFWLGFFVVFVGAAYAGQNQDSANTIVGLVTLYVALCVYGKRLHDFGKPATYMIVPFAATVAYYAYATAEISHAFRGGPQAIWQLRQRLQGPYFALMAAWSIVTFWVGIHPSEQGDNRYGMDTSERESVPMAPPATSV
jgi:uncharacterized membrane protein YhaH (DUF805 family)